MPRRPSATPAPRTRRQPAPAGRRIVIRGARVHNLRNVDLDLPRNALIVVTGVSGSGKSSLAFDTIYAEGQRRYVESLSSYARQFLERMEKPDVDLIEGISPAMAIEQKTSIRTPRSTVGTTTEVYDYLRLLFARIGVTVCSSCGRTVTRDSVHTVRTALAAVLQERGGDSLRIAVCFPLPRHPGEDTATALANLRKEGFFRLLVDGTVVDLTASPPPPGDGELLVLVDRLVLRPSDGDDRLADSVETAFASGGGEAAVVLVDDGTILRFNQRFACSTCGTAYEEPDPRLFSFNNPFGACPDCQGFGRAVGIAMDLVVPDPEKSIARGAIQPWTTPRFRERWEQLLELAPSAPLRTDVPFRELTERERDLVLNGFGAFKGVRGFFAWVEKKAYKISYRVLLSRYRGYTTCSSCGGTRLRAAARSVRVGGRTITELSGMTISAARGFLAGLELTPYERDIARRILEELRRRLAYLDDVGIGYLTLDRLSSTLSGGESQRINLATSLGSSLMGALYVLDEPSIGLHPRDNARLIAILQALRDAGNTVLVVEHDADMMRAADLIVDMGPLAGEQGGRVVCAAPLAGVLRHPESLTGRYLRGDLRIPVPSRRRPSDGSAIVCEGAAENNLRNITVRIPLRTLTCVTGVSGSGKSTLVHTVITAGLRRQKGDLEARPGRCTRLTGGEFLSAVELVDQSPIGRSPRSNPVTYIQAFDGIRGLFAGTQAAHIRGFGPGHFSFNVPGGRCETCEGEGSITVEMQFLADLYLPCDQCKGTRYRREVLDVLYRGKSISDVLGMTVDEAIPFFEGDGPGRKTARRLAVLRDVGLGYIRLGQPATTLSGGEAQRVKLAAHLAAPPGSSQTLFVLDEPTTGLHFHDVARLLSCFDALLEGGHSILMIEHHPQVIAAADYVIDLGPEAGEGGGRIVAEGTPEEVAADPASQTGKFLKPVLAQRRGT